jgi:hypothetical protein
VRPALSRGIRHVPNKLTRYVEWLSGNRRTDRTAYVLRKAGLPAPVTDAEWVLDSKFNAAEEVLRDPTLKATFKAAIDNGVEVVTAR